MQDVGGGGVQILQRLEVGDSVEVKGPIGHFHYTRPGHFLNHKHEGEASRINMIAGGTGITPMYQVMKEILSNESDTTELRLLYANQTEGDILIREEMEALQAAHPTRCALLHPALLAPDRVRAACRRAFPTGGAFAACWCCMPLWGTLSVPSLLASACCCLRAGRAWTRVHAAT